MWVNFEELPQSSRIWIYQANRALSENEQIAISEVLKEGIFSWNAHGAPLLGSFKFENSRFLIIGLDENQNAASGCSIDSSTKWIKQINERFNIDFFDRSLIYLENGELQVCSIFGVKKAISEGKIKPTTTIFNNQITLLSQLEDNWKIKAENSFYNRFFEAAI
jgi:hypothetical protein